MEEKRVDAVATPEPIAVKAAVQELHQEESEEESTSDE